jgi:hypothetical protein
MQGSVNLRRGDEVNQLPNSVWLLRAWPAEMHPFWCATRRDHSVAKPLQPADQTFAIRRKTSQDPLHPRATLRKAHAATSGS